MKTFLSQPVFLNQPKWSTT